jgi:hypothetical protein
MWAVDEIEISILDAEGGAPPVVMIDIRVPVGSLLLLGTVRIEGETLHIDGAHIDGLHPGACGRSGLNAIGRKLLEVAGVKRLIIQGGARTTGAKPGQAPARIVFPRC